MPHPVIRTARHRSTPSATHTVVRATVVLTTVSVIGGVATTGLPGWQQILFGAALGPSLGITLLRIAHRSATHPGPTGAAVAGDAADDR
ncbi:hypothetical protein [Kitasatospora sp. NPDC057223]|uniref:hypothetical protein n=1 Tax=Kitasatospora sp. NPDC057223 TaxID=3346055 RepID=UPI003644E6D6